MRKRASHQLEDRILALGPSLYWPLNADDTGDSNFGKTDQSGNGRHGTLQGGLSLGGAASLTADSTDSATDFAGGWLSSSYQPFVANEPRTVMTIVSRDTDSTVDAYWGGTYSAEWAAFSVASSSSINHWLPGSTDPEWISPGITLNQPTVLVLITNPVDDWAEVYVNGVQGARISLSGMTPAAGGSTLSVGAANDSPTWPLDGKMSHFAIWERALSGYEIKLLYRAAQGRREGGVYQKESILSASPALYWPLNWECGVGAGDGSRAFDLSGNGRHGTWVGSGITPGAAASADADPMDSSTHLPGTSTAINSSTPSYNPWGNGVPRTFMGCVERDEGTELDPHVLIGGFTTQGPMLYALSNEVLFVPNVYPGHGTNYWLWNDALPGDGGDKFHFGMTWQQGGSAPNLWIDGEAKGAGTPTDNPGGESVTGSYFTVGYQPGDYSTWELPGNVSHFAVYESILSSAQMVHIGEAVAKGPPGVIIEAAA